jgi:hypothetical protein
MFCIISLVHCSVRRHVLSWDLSHALQLRYQKLIHNNQIIAEFPTLFTELGKINAECHITIRPNAKPHYLYNPRTVPLPLLPKVKIQIETMLQQGVISPVTTPTARCAGIVSVPNPNGDVRICVDLTQLNKAVQREVHPMPTVDESLAQTARYFPNWMPIVDFGKSP